MSFDIDVAGIMNAVAWPSVVATLLIVHRRHIGKFLRDISPRIRSLCIGPFSIDLAEAKGFEPTTSAMPCRLSFLAMQSVVFILRCSAVITIIIDYLLSDSSSLELVDPGGIGIPLPFCRPPILQV
jgi:hypothetical protein